MNKQTHFREKKSKFRIGLWPADEQDLEIAYQIYINRSWRISTTPNTTKFFLSLSNLYSNLIWAFWVVLRRKIKIYWKLRFQGRNAHEPHFSGINWTFFPRIQILIFLREATQYDYIRSLYEFGRDKKFLGVLGVVDMRQLLLK